MSKLIWQLILKENERFINTVSMRLQDAFSFFLSLFSVTSNYTRKIKFKFYFDTFFYLIKMYQFFIILYFHFFILFIFFIYIFVWLTNVVVFVNQIILMVTQCIVHLLF